LSDDEPKTAYELILERLKKKDHDEGVEERPITDDQRTRIAELRKVAKAKLAEREIFFNQSRRKAADPEALAALEEEYRRDRERIQSEEDRKIEQVRGEGR
jgi:aminoglycoside phosphotransferase